VQKKEIPVNMMALKKASECFRLFGFRGVFLTAFHHLAGRPHYLPVEYHGEVVYLRFQTSDQCVYKEVVLDKDYEFDLGFTPKIIVDVGANIGLSAIFFANRYPSAKIVAIEPEDSNFAMLERNVRGYKQITPIHAAIWTNEGIIHLSTPTEERGHWDKWGITVSEDGRGQEVRAVSLRYLMGQLNLPKIDLLKMDVEGSEIEIFSTCDWLPLINVLVVETHDRFRPGCSHAADAALGEFQKTPIGSAGNLAVYRRRSELRGQTSRRLN
jgi:FkbM family methyltransferase